MTSANPRDVINQITRVGGPPSGAISAMQRARPEARALFWIRGSPRGSQDSGMQRSRRLVTSAHAEGIPIVFSLNGMNGKVSIGLGTCVFDSGDSQQSITQRADVLGRLIRFAYPGAKVDLENSPTFERHEWTCLWVGVPKQGDLARVARALSGMPFSVLVIAQPLDASTVTDLLDAAGYEQRVYHATVAESKLAEPAVTLLQSYLERFVKRMQIATAVGGWRVAVYMMAKPDCASACRAIYRAAYGTSVPGHEQLASWSVSESASWAVQWGLPHTKSIHRLLPYPWQTVLSSNELADLTSLPAEELPGFRLLDQPSFDVIPPFVASEDKSKPQVPTSVVIGRVVSEGQPIDELDYAVRSTELTKHCFIAGTTGSGKTNTVFHLLRQLARQSIPFLVIEPVKTEYRALVREPEFKGLRVYTLGDELGIPLRLNPLAPEAGTSVAEHIDMLKGVIGASIGAWNPLPQILEKALHRVFRESGWDIVRGTNYRVKGSVTPASAYPTLADLLEAGVAVTRELGYSERVGPDIEAALRVRLESLLAGGKGKMLGTSVKQSVEELVSRSTIVELESIVDQDECAFVMGVLLIKIVEHLRIRGNTSSCRLVVVVEEAHRLLGEVQRSSPEIEGNARFKAVSMFADLLAEVRAYGAGLVICDQSPSKLARDVLKNTNMKIAHRIVSADDAAALAMAMRLREDQAGALASLNPGAAAVFSGGDDYPILVAVPKVKQDDPWPTNEELRRIQPVSPAMETLDAGDIWADKLLATQEWLRAIDRLLNILIATPVAAADTWSDACDIALRHLPELPDPATILKLATKAALARALRERGRIYGWSYEELDALFEALDSVLSALTAPEYKHFESAVSAFQGRARPLHQLLRGPLLSCSMSCGKGKGVECVFRSSAARLTGSLEWTEEWRRAAGELDNNESIKELVNQAGETMIGIDRSRVEHDWYRRAAFCFSQHMIAKEKSGHPTSMILENNNVVLKLLGF